MHLFFREKDFYFFEKQYFLSLIMKKLNKFKITVKKLVFKYFSKSTLWSRLHYSIIPSSFYGEHLALFSGIYRNVTEDANLGNFRRNIHRIEKGLTTSPIKKVFAESYIIETVESLKKLNQSSIDLPTISWGFYVIHQYFMIVERTEVISKAITIFEQIKPLKEVQVYKPYYAVDRNIAKISFTDFLELNQQRRSIRYYLNKTVPRDLLENAIKVALYSPSACNRQPFMFRIIDDLLLLKDAVLLPNGTLTFSDNIKTMVFIIGDLSNYFDERDKHLIYIDGSLAAMNFVLALEILGLSSCIINWPDIPQNNIKLKNFLKLNSWEQCIMAISVGYASPDCAIPSSEKKDVKTVVKFN